MPRTHQNSLAHNLHDVLTRLGGANKDWPLYHALAKILDADDEKLFEAAKVLSRNIRVLKAQVQTCQQLRASKDMHLKNLDAWEAMLAAKRFNTPLKEHSSLLTEQNLNHLVSLNDTLSFWNPQPSLNSSTLASLRRRLNRMLEEVQGSTLQPELRAFLISELSTLVWALSNAEELGTENVYEIVTGVVARSRVMWAKEQAPQAEPVFRRFTKVASLIWRGLGGVVHVNRGVAAFRELWDMSTSGGGPPLLPPAGS